MLKEGEMPKLSRRFVLGLSVLALGVFAAKAPTNAQTFPSNVIRIVVSATPGTPPDIVSRIVANELIQFEGWRIVVENRPGAMQTIAGSDVLKQPADGLTIMSVSLPSAVAPSLLPALNYRLDTEFAPVIKLMTANHVLVVNPSVPARSLADLVALLKSQPDKLQFSSGGFGTPAHLAGEAFKLQTGVRAAHVPYSALPQAIGDLLNGTNHYQFITPLPVLDLIATGKLRALAVTAPDRIAALKDVPTVAEAGFPALIIQDWVGLLVKAGTPNETVARFMLRAETCTARSGRGAIVVAVIFVLFLDDRCGQALFDARRLRASGGFPDQAMEPSGPPAVGRGRHGRRCNAADKSLPVEFAPDLRRVRLGWS
jgi:tripartite-type tricarboxylate transporter receptor subunit TctC